MVSDACLVVSGSCLVMSVGVWWCLMVFDACQVESEGVWCMSSGVLSDACLVRSGGV